MTVIEGIRLAAVCCILLSAIMGVSDFKSKCPGKGMMMIGFSILLSYGLAVNMGIV